MKQPDFAFSQGWWYPAILGTALLLFILIMPKRLSWKEIYITFGIIGFIVWMVDITLAVPFDIFDIGDPKKEGISELFLYGVIPSCLSVIYLNFFTQSKKWSFVSLQIAYE